MDDALVRIVDIEQPDARGGGCGARLPDEVTAVRHQRRVTATRPGVDDVVDGAEHLRRLAHRTAAFAQALQRHRAGAFVQEDPVDGEQRFRAGLTAVRGRDKVLAPDFVKYRAPGGRLTTR